MIGRRQRRLAPPGYAEAAARRGRGASLLGWVLPAVCLTLALDQLLLVQPELYLRGSTWPHAGALRWFVAGSAVGGYFLRMRGTIAWLLAACGLACSGLARFWAFAQGPYESALAVLPAALAAVAIGSAIRALRDSPHERPSFGEGLVLLVHPLALVPSIGAIGAIAVACNAIGPVRASLVIAGGLVVTALLTAQREAAMATHAPTLRARARLTWPFWLGNALLFALCCATLMTEGIIPVRRVLTSSHHLVYLARSPRCELEVTSGQGAYHTFVDGELRFSSFDEKRWAESLVRPALARVRSPRRALVLSTGEGLIERELLRDGELNQITSVVRCGLLPELARSSAWLGELTAHAMNSARVTLVVRDPAVFVMQSNDTQFDIVVVDLPDPASPQQSKYYSRYFYRRLHGMLSPDGILVVQATSARRSPRTFATIGVTLEAAGFAIQPAMVPLISRGEWSLYFATNAPFPGVIRPEWEATSLAATTAGQFFHPWPDCLPPSAFSPIPSRLNDATVLDWFERESEAGATATDAVVPP